MEHLFDRSKPFYPYIVNYYCSLHGFSELMARKLGKEIQELKKQAGPSFDQNWSEISKDLGLSKQSTKWILNGDFQTTKLIYDFDLKSLRDNRTFKIDAEEISALVFDDSDLVVPKLPKASEVLLLSCFEEVRESHDMKDELWNFFYHCRNAAAHGGYFNIETNNKRFPAKWSSFEITHKLNKTRLIHNDIEGGFLGYYDPIIFLNEIEKKYFDSNKKSH